MLDHLLTACLLGLVPAYALGKQWATRGKPPTSKTVRYLQATLLAALLSSILALDWLAAGRSPSMLGLQWPPPIAGWIGLGIALVILAGLSVGMWAEKTAGKRPQTDETAALLPDTKAELWLFVVFSLVIGTAWEVLFRGYLIWALEPRLTTAGAVAAAAAAYGLAHGFKSLRQFLGSLLAALLFTTAYVLTRSLWWLMLIHAGLPLLAFLVRCLKGYSQKSETLSPEASHPA